MGVLPIKTRLRGPAPCLDPASVEEDQIDEAIKLFRANVLFRNFEVLGAADRTLIYLTLSIHQVCCSFAAPVICMRFDECRR